MGEAHRRHVVRELVGRARGSRGSDRPPPARAATSPGAPRRSLMRRVEALPARRARPSRLRRPRRSRRESQTTEAVRGVVRLEGEGERIGLEREGSRPGPRDLELVAGASPTPGKEELPDAVAGVQAHRVPPAVPAVPVADHAHAPRVGRPHREDDAGHAVDGRRRGRPACRRRGSACPRRAGGGRSRTGSGKPVGILDLHGFAVVVGDAEPVGHGAPAAAHDDPSQRPSGWRRRAGEAGRSRVTDRDLPRPRAGRRAR